MSRLNTEIDICISIAQNGNCVEKWLSKRAFAKLNQIKRIHNLRLIAPNISFGAYRERQIALKRITTC